MVDQHLDQLYHPEQLHDQHDRRRVPEDQERGTAKHLQEPAEHELRVRVDSAELHPRERHAGPRVQLRRPLLPQGGAGLPRSGLGNQEPPIQNVHRIQKLHDEDEAESADEHPEKVEGRQEAARLLHEADDQPSRKGGGGLQPARRGRGEADEQDQEASAGSHVQ